ncbi:plasmid pRiA4b ORF-3 family protein [Desulforegula conservatrix]|uniref:plasmid pRiA4b ORF-3 family protein n=1 Tax=Desulforegula conservatrix TaxID=153026 RepID=UPI0004014F18|nr:plasmid pRiA4b ORF-3 family protein [Desulforegula conservatrix]
MAKPKEKILQLKIQLRGSKPPIWRRIFVKESTTLGSLHEIIQIAMGWTDSHLHSFIYRGEEYGTPDPEFDFGDEMKNENRYKIGSLLKKPKDKMTYTYDFGDNWEHVVTFEDIETDCKETFLPVCIAGKKACPPENCGGVDGYYGMLDELKDGANENIEEIREWLGEDFNPDFFDINEINKALKAMFT